MEQTNSLELGAQKGPIGGVVKLLTCTDSYGGLILRYCHKSLPYLYNTRFGYRVKTENWPQQQLRRMSQSNRVAEFLSKSIDASIRGGHSRFRLTSRKATGVRQQLPQETHAASAHAVRLYHDLFKYSRRVVFNNQGVRDKTVMAGVRKMPVVRLIHCESRSRRGEYGDNGFASVSPSLADSTR